MIPRHQPTADVLRALMAMGFQAVKRTVMWKLHEIVQKKEPEPKVLLGYSCVDGKANWMVVKEQDLKIMIKRRLTQPVNYINLQIISLV